MGRNRALMCLIMSAVIISGCGDDARVTSSQLSGAALRGDFSDSGTGTLRAANVLPTFDLRLKAVTSIAAKVVYVSSSGIDGQWTTVSGTVFAPRGNAPDGGWPIIAIGHATAGVQPDCAPSRSPTLLDLAPVVTLLVQAGYVVTVADYQGLGDTSTYYPYLDSTTAGNNIIDSVRAARKLVPNTSNRWLVLGISEGGQAAWAANELAENYGYGLALVGSVSLAPHSDLTPFADAAAAGQLTTEQKAALQLILATLKNAYPDINLDDYRRGIVTEQGDLLSRCDVKGADARSKVIDQITDNDLRPSSPQAVAALRAYLQKMSLPQGPTAAPMFVIYGGKDPLLPVEWTNGALAQACRMGDVIDIQLQPDKGHSDLDITTTFAWITARFNGEPAPNSCESPPPPSAPSRDGV
jgi:pimeloyl-ACP methyl ester carboxylesterase